MSEMALQLDPGRLMTRPWFKLCLPILMAGIGCSKSPPPAKPIDVNPQVSLVKAELRTIIRDIGQPGFIYAYEQTAIYPKVAGYVQKWNVDIGDRIKKDQEIATLYIPELNAELAQKNAQVELDEAQIQVAERMVEVATNYVNVAAAHVDETKANVNKSQASVERWESEVKRLEGLSGQGVVDKQVLDESRKQLKADTAARGAAEATVVAAKAAVLARKADLDKAQADVTAARAKAKVAREDAKRLAALVSYTHITAPYDGVVVVRNVNTFDFVQPGSGDQSVSTVAPGQSGAHMPLYEVARTDLIRVYVDVPEMDANSVTRGTPARVRVQALRDEDFASAVTRTSWSLRRETRTLRAEIDLPNPEARLLPGMYAYGKVLVRHDNVRALPMGAVVELGNQNCCFIYDNGKAIQTPVQTGVNDGKWIEVAKKRAPEGWTNFTGDEEVILGDLSELSDGQKVEVIKSDKK
jgi:HlyD family secretion protein